MHRHSVLLLVLAFTNAFEFGKAGCFGAVVEFSLGASDRWRGDLFFYGRATFRTSCKGGFFERMHCLKTVNTVGTANGIVAGYVIIDRHNHAKEWWALLDSNQ